jgi:CTP:molybdopterin cytidylyltransferase MocA
VVVLADQPLLDPEIVRGLVEAWKAGAVIARPRYRDATDTPGHPVLLDRSMWHLAVQASGERGLGPLLDSLRDRVTVLEVPGTNPGIDTPEDLARLEDDT